MEMYDIHNWEVSKSTLQTLEIRLLQKSKKTTISDQEFQGLLVTEKVLKIFFQTTYKSSLVNFQT